MSNNNLRIAIFLCNCGNTLNTSLNFPEIQNYLKKHENTASLFYYEDLCFDTRLDEIVNLYETNTFDCFIVAACTPQIIEMIIRNKLKTRNLDPNFEIVNIREHIAWVHNNKEKATQKAIMLIKAAIAKIKSAIKISKKETKIRKYATIIGAGVSGLSIASDLSVLGFEVLVIEKNPWLGGHLIQLENVSSFERSGKEIIRDILQSLGGKPFEFKLNTEVKWIEGGIGNFSIHLKRSPPYINTKCSNCRKCVEICPVTLKDPINEGLVTIKAIDQSLGPPFGEQFVIRREHCTPNCNLCEQICPEGAINLTLSDIEETIKTSFIIFSTGYDLYRPDEKSIYQPGRTSDILTQLQIARMLDPDGPTQGKVIRPSSGEVAQKILMIQCVGSRDVRQAEYCSKYCCSTAIQHAIKIKEQVPDCEICISYIDIRTPFLDEEIYRKARQMGIDFTRGKIGNIEIQSDKFTTELIDTILARQINFESDIIVLSTAMLPNKLAPEIPQITNLKMREDGFIQEYYPKLKLTETNKVGMYICGAVTGPKLVSECIADSHSVAMSIVKEFPTETFIKDKPISIVNAELCNGCELCVRLCPFKIPLIIDRDEKKLAVIDENQCKGCGTCVSLCPTNAVQLESLQRDQLIAQIKEILSDATENDDPIILGFVCEECAYATIDFAGMLRKTYSENTRFIRLPCLGRLSLLDILTAFEYGADLILLFGCEEAKCHYLEGNIKAKLMVEIGNELLDAIGWGSSRIKIFGLFSADSDKFLDAIKGALVSYEKIGHSPSRLEMLKEFGK